MKQEQKKILSKSTLFFSYTKKKPKGDKMAPNVLTCRPLRCLCVSVCSELWILKKQSTLKIEKLIIREPTYFSKLEK